ncbi:MarR family winged helix-turn-helix transcriptional regulator [Celerinatantimonas yamalensis]|uniref:MarR family transcriptional regulator n=1 Tax=Celerinatantimonas yamalensis TaxID=559956 RepID=A0ABW9G3S0_9GAMM
MNNDTAIQKIEYNLSYLARWLEANHRRRNYPLERAHYLLLCLLTEKSPQSSGILAAQLGLDSSTVTRQIKAMIDLQLLQRLPDPCDRRGCLINVTALGVEKYNAMQEIKRHNVEKIFQDWSPEDKEQLGDLLAKVNESIYNNLDKL